MVLACDGGEITSPALNPPTALDPTDPPFAPSDLQAVVSVGQIDLSWTDNSLDEDDFEIQRRERIGGVWGGWTSLVSVGADVTNHTDATVTAGNGYRYRVRACNVVGCSARAYSAFVDAVASVPLAPSNVIATPSPGQIDLIWTDNASDETSFDLERRERVGGVWGGWTNLISVGVDVTNHTDVTVSEGNGYRYRVKACNAAGCSDPVLSAFVDAVAASVPLAPTDVVATPSGGDIEVTWTDNASNEETFEIQRRERTGGTWGGWTALTSVGLDVTSHTDASVTAGNGYRYRVRSCNIAGCSEQVFSGFVDAVAVVPAVPTDLVATPSPGQVDLTWTDNASNEVSFDIERRERVSGVWGGWAAVASVSPDVTNYADASVTEGNGYRYRVQACNASGCSDHVNSAFVDAVASVPLAPTDVLATPSPGQIDVTWTDNASDEESYEIQRRERVGGVWGGWTSLVSLGANVTNHTDATVGTCQRQWDTLRD